MTWSDGNMQDLAASSPAQPRAAPPAVGAVATAEAGERLVKQHFCSSCHTPALMGQKHIPRLAGQQQEYLLKQLRGFKAQTAADLDRKSTRLNSSHGYISYAVFCLKKKKEPIYQYCDE